MPSLNHNVARFWRSGSFSQAHVSGTFELPCSTIGVTVSAYHRHHDGFLCCCCSTLFLTFLLLFCWMHTDGRAVRHHLQRMYGGLSGAGPDLATPSHSDVRFPRFAQRRQQRAAPSCSPCALMFRQMMRRFDAYGHAFGDAVLSALPFLLRHPHSDPGPNSYPDSTSEPGTTAQPRLLLPDVQRGPVFHVGLSGLR